MEEAERVMREDRDVLRKLAEAPVFPRVDDHLVVPEVTRDEIIRGRRVVALPALPPRARKKIDLDYVVRAFVAPGYRTAADLLTRFGETSDFANDVCIYKEGLDPSTDARYLEEIAFQVISERGEQDVMEKAEEMHLRGVRRIFAIFVEGPRLCEWSPESGSWQPLDADSRIEDRCLVAPLAVASLLDPALADAAVLDALIAKGNPVILKWKAETEARGKAERVAESILRILEVRGVAVSAAQREEILCCSDYERLGRCLVRAALASSADEVTAEL